MKLTVALMIVAAAFAQLDPNIPLSGRPPQISAPDPLGDAIRIQAIRNMRIQQQLDAEHLKTMQMENQRGGQVSNVATEGGGRRVAVGLPTATCLAGNGRLWKNLSRATKIDYLVGYAEGLIASSTVLDKYFPKFLSYDETVGAMDAFYEDFLHAPVRILDAVQVIGMKANGLDQSVIEARTTYAIGLANRCAEADEKAKAARP